MEYDFEFAAKRIRDAVDENNSRMYELASTRAEYAAAKENSTFQAAYYLGEIAGKVHSLEHQLTELQESHKHDIRNNILLAIFSALVGSIIGTVCTILATKAGWL